jgi:hypothetical protein
MATQKGVIMLRDATSARHAGALGVFVVAILAFGLASVGGTLACGEVKAGGESPGMAKTEEFVAGEIVVWFDDGASEAEIEAAIKATGGEVVRRSDVTPSRVTISIPAGEEDDYVAAYRKLAIVRAADKNYVVKAFAGEAAVEPGGEMKTKIGGE